METLTKQMEDQLNERINDIEGQAKVRVTDLEREKEDLNVQLAAYTSEVDRQTKEDIVKLGV